VFRGCSDPCFGTTFESPYRVCLNLFGTEPLYPVRTPVVPAFWSFPEAEGVGGLLDRSMPNGSKTCSNVPRTPRMDHERRWCRSAVLLEALELQLEGGATGCVAEEGLDPKVRRKLWIGKLPSAYPGGKSADEFAPGNESLAQGNESYGGGTISTLWSGGSFAGLAGGA
jgi:hypothetical protein